VTVTPSPTCRVVELTAETGVDDPPEIPLHLMPSMGSVAIQLRSTVSRVCVGAGLARRTELLERMREAGGMQVAASPAGGTVVVTGPGVLGFCAIGVPPPEATFSLDWMLSKVAQWFRTALTTYDVGNVSVGKVEGAWCPGFSDIAVGGKKLVGLGFRVTKDWVVVRGVLPVIAYNDAEVKALIKCHELIGVVVEAEKFVALEQCTDRKVDVADLMERWSLVTGS
jgi:lipoate-protein ligase A